MILYYRTKIHFNTMNSFKSYRPPSLSAPPPPPLPPPGPDTQKKLGPDRVKPHLWHSWCWYSTILHPVHTTPFSNENDENDHRKRIVSKTLSRVERSENGTVWKRCFPSVDGENDTIWKRWRHHNTTTWVQTTQPWVSKITDRRFLVASLLIVVIFSLLTLLKAHLTVLIFWFFKKITRYYKAS